MTSQDFLKSSLIILLASICCHLDRAYADVAKKAATRSLREVSLQGDFESLDRLLTKYRLSELSSELVGPTRHGRSTLRKRLSFSGYLPGQGRVQFFLKEARAKDWQAIRYQGGKPEADQTKVLLLRGALMSQRLGAKSLVPLAAAVYESQAANNAQGASLHLRFKNKRSRVRQAPTFFKLTIPLPASCLSECKMSPLPSGSSSSESNMQHPGLLRHIPQAFLASHFCNVEGKNPHTPEPKEQQPANPSRLESAASTNYAEQSAALPADVSWVTEIATEADGDYVRRNGSSSNNEIAALVDAADMIYQRDLAAQLTLTRQIMRDPAELGEVSAEELLTDFRNRTNSSHELGKADLYHLFSGRTFSGRTIGLSYLGVLCVEPTYSYGESEDYDPSLNYIILAHELGHNFGAGHDSITEPRSLMYPSADASQNSFSDFSKSEIAIQLRLYGNLCLQSTGNPNPTPPPATPKPTAGGPTPNPTSSVPPGGGGGIDTGNDFQLSLRAVLRSSGSFEAQGRVSGPISGLCSGSLVASESRSFTKRSTVASFAGLSRELTFSAELTTPALAPAGGSNKRPFAYMRIQYVCPKSALNLSDTIRIDASKIKPSKTKNSNPLTLSRWISQLAKKMKVTAPPPVSN